MRSMRGRAGQGRRAGEVEAGVVRDRAGDVIAGGRAGRSNQFRPGRGGR